MCYSEYEFFGADRASWSHYEKNDGGFSEEEREAYFAEDYDDGMDGDHDSCMRDIGWGTDEDYGHYENDGDY